MNKVYTLFAELLKLCLRYQFEKATERYKGDRYVKTFTTWQQYNHRPLFPDYTEGQPAGYRDRTWYTIRPVVSSGLKRDTQEHALRCQHEKGLPAPKHRFRFKNPLYTIDATTIDLCLSVFPWAKFRKTKGAIKMHCLYDHSGALPDSIR